MAVNINNELLAYLTAAKAIEQQSLALMRAGIERAGDQQIASLYRAHHEQTEAHVAWLAERSAACGASSASLEELDSGLAAIDVRIPSRASSATLAAAAYAYENLEIAIYHLLRGVAQRAGDHETVAVVEHILEQEEAAAEVIASMIDRALEVSLSEPPRSQTGHFEGKPGE